MKKRNAQDATLRNIRALKKRVSVLETVVKIESSLINWCVKELGGKERKKK